MLFVLVLLGTIATALGAQVACPETTPGTKNNVFCVSKTEFVLGFQDPKRDLFLECPPGTVCVNEVEICSASLEPYCYNEIPGVAARCNECNTEDTTTKPVCIDEYSFSFCVNGKVFTALAQTCPEYSPYCKIVENQSTCTADPREIDCPVLGNCRGSGKCSGGGDGSGSGDGSGGGSGTFTCTQAGFFPDTSDLTCQSYFKCQANSQGELVQTSSRCATGYRFDTIQKRCVLGSGCPK